MTGKTNCSTQQSGESEKSHFKIIDESTLQIALVNWLHREYPNAWLATHHSPNGGYRTKVTGAQMKLMGTRPGFPDLATFWPRDGWTGIAMELKWKNGRTTPAQEWWLDRLLTCGFQVNVCRNLDEAKRIYTAYLGAPMRDSGER